MQSEMKEALIGTQTIKTVIVRNILRVSKKQRFIKTNNCREEEEESCVEKCALIEEKQQVSPTVG